MWFAVCHWPQSQEGIWVRPHLFKVLTRWLWTITVLRSQHNSLWRNTGHFHKTNITTISTMLCAKKTTPTQHTITLMYQCDKKCCWETTLSNVIYFPTPLTNASALPGKTWTSDIAVSRMMYSWLDEVQLVTTRFLQYCTTVTQYYSIDLASVATTSSQEWAGVTDRISHDAEERAHEQDAELQPATRRKRLIHGYLAVTLSKQNTHYVQQNYLQQPQ